MRGVWIDKGNVPNAVKLSGYGIRRPYFDVTDPLVNKDFLNKWRQPPFDSVGVYADASWLFPGDPAGFAQWLSDRLDKVAPATGAGFPHVMADMENASLYRYPGGLPSYVTVFLAQWRQLRPTRLTEWTLDGMQGPLWNNRPVDVQTVVGANVEIVPQAYSGSYVPWAADIVKDDLEAFGFPRERMSVFRLGEDLPAFWQGYAFTQGRLP